MAQRHASRGKSKRKKSGGKSKKGKVILIVSIVLVVAAAAAAAFMFLPRFFNTMKYPMKYSEYVEKSSKENNLDPNLVYAVILTESKFEPKAQSNAPAYGLMQMTETTFNEFMSRRGEEGKYTVNDLFTPSVSIDYGCCYLRYLLDYYGDNEICAIAAYNGGMNTVDEWLSNSEVCPDGVNLIVDKIPYDETKKYVQKVEEAKKMYKELY